MVEDVRRVSPPQFGRSAVVKKILRLTLLTYLSFSSSNGCELKENITEIQAEMKISFG